jgi:predicted MFS family arabinose efflux permease
MDPARSTAVAQQNEFRRTAAVVIAGFCAFLGLYAPQPMLPELAAEFHQSPGQISQLISIATIAVALAAPFIGNLSDRWGRKRLIVFSAVLLALPTAMAATAASFSQLLAWRFLVGLFTPGIFALTVTYINEEWTAGAGRAMSAYVSGTVSGGFVGRMIAACIADYGNWRMTFVVLGALNLLGALLIWKLLPVEEHRSARVKGMARTMLGHLGNRQLLATYAAGFCVLFSLLGVFTYVNFLLAAAPFNMRPAALGRIFVVYLAGAVFTPLAGRFIDRLGQRQAFTLAMLLALAGVLLTLIPSVLAVMAGLAIFCTGIFIGQSSASSYIGKAATGARAAAVGLYVTAYYLGGSFGAAVPGLFWSRFGWTGCVALMAVVQLLTAGIAMSFWQSKTRLMVPLHPKQFRLACGNFTLTLEVRR